MTLEFLLVVELLLLQFYLPFHKRINLALKRSTWNENVRLIYFLAAPFLFDWQNEVKN